MSGHFSAFSFVDKIDSVEVGKSISGRYFISESCEHFKRSLCCEAVGQCAAWSAMAAMDFQYRPVAGITSSIEFLGEARPGETLVMTAEISRADAEAVTYSGLGTVDGREIVRLNRCLGPMLPMTDFDEPALVEARWNKLRNEGAEPGLFPGVRDFFVTITSKEDDRVEGKFTVPRDEGFFEDHFPAKPVFPGTLFMDLCVQFAEELTDEGMRPTGISNAKLRDFMGPGDELFLNAQRKSDSIVEIFLDDGIRAKRVVKILFSSA